MSGGEHVLVAGAGITGLGVALALGGSGRRITLLDRDPAPPDMSPEEAFRNWERRGATQLRHSHAFIGRLNKLLRERHPGTAGGIAAARARGSSPMKMRWRRRCRRTMRPAPGDEDLTLLFSRRTTLELVLRRYTARLPGVEFVSDAGVRGVLTRREGRPARSSKG